MKKATKSDLARKQHVALIDDLTGCYWELAEAAERQVPVAKLHELLDKLERTEQAYKASRLAAHNAA